MARNHTHEIIKFDSNSAQSISSALKDYQELLKTNKAFRSSVFNIRFQTEQEDMKLNAFSEHPHLQEFLFKHCEPLQCIENLAEANLIEVMASETLLFLFALQHEDLKNALLKTAETIVAYARHINDSSELWYNEETCFGAEALHALAHCYPEYGYLLASFFVPNWDDEHMGFPLNIFGNWCANQGVNQYSIKAFVHCDNLRARQMALGYDSWNGYSEHLKVDTTFNLLEILRESSSLYPYFKENISKRLENQPLLGGYTIIDESLTPENFVKSIAIEMMLTFSPVDLWDDSFDIDEYLIERWIRMSAELEIKEFIEHISEHSQLSIEIPKLSWETDKEEDAVVSELSLWMSFFRDAFENGQQLCEYIEFGEHSEAIEKISSTDLYQLIEEHSEALWDAIDELYIETAITLYSKLDRVCRSLFEEVDETLSTELDQLNWKLRFTDILFRCHNKKVLPERYLEKISKDYQLVSEQELNERYQADWESSFYQQANKISSYFSGFNKKALSQSINLISQNREKAYKICEKDLFNYEIAKSKIGNSILRKELGTAERLTLAIELYKKDLSSGSLDHLSSIAIEFSNRIIKDCLFADLQEILDVGRHETIIEKIERNEIKELSEYEKSFLPEAYQWIAFKNYILTGELTTLRDAAQTPFRIEDFMAVLSKKEERVSYKQDHIDWLSDEYSKKMLIVYHLAIGFMAVEYQAPMKRLLEFAFQIAPLVTTKTLIDFHANADELYDLQAVEAQSLKLQQQGAGLETYWSALLYYGFKYEDTHGNFKAAVLEIVESYAPQAAQTAFEKLSYRKQYQILKKAKEFSFNQHYEDKFKEQFLNRFARYLQKDVYISNPEIYFRNKAEASGHLVQHIKWNAWEKHASLAHKLLTDVTTGNKPRGSKEEIQQQIYEKSGWGYLILQEDKGEYSILKGHELLAQIQAVYSDANWYSAQTHGIIVSKDCPSEYLQEIEGFDQDSFPKFVTQQVESFFNNEITYAEINQLLKLSLDIFERVTNHNDFYLGDLLTQLGEEDLQKAVQVLSPISLLMVYENMGLKIGRFVKLMLDYKIDTQYIVQFLLKENATDAITNLATQEDLTDFIDNQTIETKITLLNCVASLPNYQAYIEKLCQHRSRKLASHAKLLYENNRENR